MAFSSTPAPATTGDSSGGTSTGLIGMKNGCFFNRAAAVSLIETE
jgi:hypothetical protein